MVRRWRSGWTHTEAGISFRVVPGVKPDPTGPRDGPPHPDDLRLEWYTPNGWRPVTMAAGAIMADFWYENEEVLYPRERGYRGGEKYAFYVTSAMRSGWEVAERPLQEEKAARRSASPVPSKAMPVCTALSPDGGMCALHARHAGPHRNSEYVWPNEVAS